MRNHLGTSFKVWNRRQSWFWLVLNPHGNAGAIGTAATEADAVREACSSIEELVAQRPAFSASCSPGGESPALNAADQCKAAFGWVDWWMIVAHQLTGKMLIGWADVILGSS
jgi:hypothetical protein